MKRIISLILALIMVIGLLPEIPVSISAVDNDHEVAAGDPNNITSRWPECNTDLTHIICYGQSFSVGADAPYYADETVDGVYVYGSITNSANGTKLEPLSESAGNQHPIISAGNVLAKLLAEAGCDTDIILGSYGSGGRTIAQLMSSQRQSQIKEEEGYSYDILSSGRYEVFQNSVSALAQYAQNKDQSISCPAIVYLQGETDQNTDSQLGYPENPVRAGYGAGGDKEKYKEYMSRLKEDMQREVMEQYGQRGKPLFIIYQVSGTYTRTQYSSINMAQMEFAQENDDVILVQTPYFASHYIGNHHLTQNGYRWLGEYIGRAIYTALVEHKKSWPIMPEDIAFVDADTVRITVSGAKNGLTIDTWTVENASNSKNLYGFYLQVDGQNIVPSEVATFGNTIELTLPSALRAETAYLYYAGKNASGTGNIRDNSVEQGFYEYLDDSNDTGTGNNQGVSHSSLDEDGNSIVGRKYPMYNWLASFCYKIEVPEAAQRQPSNYHWEMRDTGLVSVTDGNAAPNDLTLLQGSVVEGVLTKAQYAMENPIVLEHDRPWVIEWKAAGNGNSYPGGKFLVSSSANTSGAQYLYLPADSRGMVAWGVSGDSANYGFQLKNLGIDVRAEHTYRIENRISNDGTNTVYLLVDGEEIGPMTTGYRTSSNASGSAGSVIEEPKNWANGKDIYLNGLGEGSSFLLNNMKLSYLKVWENGVPHSHIYKNGSCTVCGCNAEKLSLRYDDHYDITGREVVILDAGIPTSVQPNGTPNSAVVALRDNYLVAVGIGTAYVEIDGISYFVTVEKAKIQLIVIMGQSNAGNHFKNATSDVTCPVGTAYWWGNGQGTAATEPVRYTQPSMGFHTPLLAELYAQSVANGDPVKNVMIWQEGITSKNGQSITKWASSATDTSGSDDTVAMIENCRAYYTQRSDHYQIVDSGVYWLQGESDLSMNPLGYIQRFMAMWQRLKNAGMDYLAFFRVRRAVSNQSEDRDDLFYSASLSAQIRMINENPEFYLATDLTENWVGTADISHTVDISNYITVMETYGKNPTYTDSYGNAATYADGKLTTTMKCLYGSNNVCHYGKFGYGLIGADAAYNMYRARHTETAAIVVTDTSGYADRKQILLHGQEMTIDTTNMTDNLSFRVTCGSTAGTLKLTVRSGETDVTNQTDFIVASGQMYGSVSISALQDYEDISIEVTYTTASGKNHTILCKVLTPPPQPQTDYVWDFDEDLNARDKDGNVVNALLADPLQGSYTLENGYLTGDSLQLKLEQVINLKAGKNWYVEWKYGEFTSGTAGFLLCEDPGNTVGNKAFYHIHNGRLMISDYADSDGYRNYTSSAVTISAGDCIRISNHYDPTTGKSTLSLWQNGKLVIADFQLKGSMNNYTDSMDMTGYPLTGDFAFGYLGNRGMASWGVDCQLDYLKIVFGDEHNYTSVVTTPTCTEQGYTTYTCTTCGDSYVADYVDACGYDWMLEDGEFKILLIGNSFSEDASNAGMPNSQMLDILQAMLGENVKVTVGLCYSGGKGLNWHATQSEQGNRSYSLRVISSESGKWKSYGSYTSADALTWTDWDVVSLQHYEINTTTGKESNAYPDQVDPKFDNLKSATEFMLDYVDQYAPDAAVYFYMHWARAYKSNLNESIATYNKMAAFFPEVLDYAGTNSANRFETIIPVGLAVQNARTTYLATLAYNTTAYADKNLNLYTDAQIGLQRDGGHLSYNVGRYIAALTFAEIIIPHKLRAEGYTLPDIRITESVGKLPKEYSIIAQKAVHAAVESWSNGSLEVTNIEGYTQDPTVEATKILQSMHLSLRCGDAASMEQQITNVVLSGLPADFVVDKVVVTTEAATVTIRYGYTSKSVVMAYVLVNHTYQNGICVGCGAMLGDLNLDGLVNSDDLTILARHVGHIELLTDPTALANADVNGDGSINSDDLTLHARYVGRIIDAWPEAL